MKMRRMRTMRGESLAECEGGCKGGDGDGDGYGCSVGYEHHQHAQRLQTANQFHHVHNYHVHNQQNNHNHHHHHHHLYNHPHTPPNSHPSLSSSSSSSSSPSIFNTHSNQRPNPSQPNHVLRSHTSQNVPSMNFAASIISMQGPQASPDDEEVKGLIVPWRKHARMLREVQFVEGAVWRRAWDGDVWCKRYIGGGILMGAS